MSSLEPIDVYCLNFENDKRRADMTNMFNKFDCLNVNWYKGVSINDMRIPTTIKDSNKRAWSTCYGHLDMINSFVNDSNKDFAIFCEDDILIRNDFMKQLPLIIDIFTQNEFDILLLGYLCERNLNGFPNFPEIHVSKPPDFPLQIFKYLGLETVWGAQMYLLSRKQGQYLLDKYYTDYAERTLSDKNMTPFSADWTITKEGNRALIFPLLAIENNTSTYDDYGQMRSRIACYNFSYSKEMFG